MKGIRILCIGDDEGIRFSRELVLRQEGYEVESATSDARFDSPWVRSFPIVVLCHSLDSNSAAKVAEKLRQRNPAIAVVRIHSIRSIQEQFYDVDCEVLPGPDQLLSVIQSVAMRLAPRDQPQVRNRA